MRDIDRGIAAALAASAITSVIGFLSVPVYVRFLGVEGYGLVGFLATLQALLQIFDFGIAATINREVARGMAGDSALELMGIVRAAAFVYWLVAFAIALFMLLSAPVIARTWLNGVELSEGSLALTVALMGLVIAARWPAQLYQNGLLGAQRIVVSSVFTVGYSIAANLGAIVVLATVAPTIQAFLGWQAAAALLNVLALRLVMYKVIGPAAVRADFVELTRLTKFSLGVTAVTATGILLGQADKVLASRAVELEQFGHYMLAVTASSLLYLIAAPMFNVFYPRFSELVKRRDDARLSGTYHLSMRLLACLLFPFAMFMSVCSVPLVHLWTGKPAVASEVGMLLPAYVAGAALHGIMHVPYALQLAQGDTRVPLTINVALLVVVLPLAWILVEQRAAVGAALSWLIFQVLYLLIGSWITHRRFLQGSYWRSLTHDVAVPALIAASFGVAVMYWCDSAQLGSSGQLLAGVTAMASAVAVGLASSPTLRAVARARIEMLRSHR